MSIEKLDIKLLVDKLNYHTELYDKGEPIISDQEWDNMYFKLVRLEHETKIILENSPTQKINYKVVSELQKSKHNHAMLSLDKTKDTYAVSQFLDNKDWIAMLKMDGLTCSLTYNEYGVLVKGETRGDGIIGEDITHNVMVIPSIPKIIAPLGFPVSVDGEIICKYADFEEFKNDYKNPRNFASGSIRLLDANECEKRKLSFIAWDIIVPDNIIPFDWFDTLKDKLMWLEKQKFKSVNFITDSIWLDGTTTEDKVKMAIHELKYAANGIYPIDGIVFKYNEVADYASAGRTEHHFKGGLAYKFADEIVDTKLLDIEWSMGRTGTLCPVAIYEEVELLGTTCSRASLHNLSILENLLGKCPYRGQGITIFKANEIIPQILSANTEIRHIDQDDILIPPFKCPCCGANTIVRESEGDTLELYCTNPDCEGKLLNKLEHFASKKGLDIKGLGKTVIEKLIDKGWLNSVVDIFKLKDHKQEWQKMAGFGLKSVDNILAAIDKSSTCDLNKFICALGIPEIGKVASQTIVKEFDTWNSFIEAVESNYDFSKLEGIGATMDYCIKHYDYTAAKELQSNGIVKCYQMIGVDLGVEQLGITNQLAGKTICITGKLTMHKNREELQSKLESVGAKVTSSVSSKTDILINNDINSTSAKNIKAKELNIPILTENDIISMLI